MELTSQELRHVEFGSELRGYKTSEVDDFLERVAIGIDQAHEEIAALKERLDRAERLSVERSNLDDEESIRRTLVLAQRTADLAIKEAQEEAGQLLDGARSDAEAIVADARQAAERIASESDRRLRDEVERLGAERERLRRELDALNGLFGAERERLSESLTTMLSFVEKNLAVSADLTSSPEPAAEPVFSEPAAVEEDDLEAAIAADAAAAAPVQGGPPRVSEPEWDDPALSRPSLMALPSLEDLGLEEDTQPTAGWTFNPEAGSPAS
jgi:cell division initiation protein